MRAQSTLQAIGIIIASLIILLIFLSLIFPAMCNAGITALCGI